MLGIGFLNTLIIDFLFFNRISASFLKRFFLKRSAIVFVYHLVCDSTYEEFLKFKNLSQIDTDLFRNHLNWLSNNGFSFVTIDELSDKLIKEKELPSNLIAITFDDGFKVTMNNALPVLESLDIKATFFITTDWIDSNVLLWQQKYYWYLKNYGLKDFFNKIKEIDKESFAGLNPFQCHYKFMQFISPKQKAILLRQYNRPIPNEREVASSIYLSSKDVLRLNSLGMQIGSHSCGHYFMQNLADDEYFNEMLNSKQKLENLIKEPVQSFSYPFNSYKEDEEIIEKVGYRTLCTVDSCKANKFSSLTKLPRFDAPIRKILFKNSLRKIVYFKK